MTTSTARAVSRKTKCRTIREPTPTRTIWSNSGDNSGMHAGGTAGSSYQRQQPENPSQYGSKTGSYWEEKGSDREHSAENRMNEQDPDKRQ